MLTKISPKRGFREYSYIPPFLLHFSRAILSMLGIIALFAELTAAEHHFQVPSKVGIGEWLGAEPCSSLCMFHTADSPAG